MNHAHPLARQAIGALLEGHEPSSVTPDQLGPYGEVYVEMQRAYQQGGKDAARKVYLAYAERSADLVALIAADPEPPKQVWSVAELLATEFPEPTWAIPDLLPTGLVVLAGRPKLGKSWLALQMAVAVGTGGKVLGRDAARGKVFYLALEDSERRIRRRLERQGAPADGRIDFRFDWQPLSRGGTADLMATLNEQSYTLVVIDTISRALGMADQMDQADMTVSLGGLQRLAIERDITILLVDHHRKGGAQSVGDVVDDVMGATSKVGVADAAMGLYRERRKREAVLKVTGRDIDDQELAIAFDPVTCCWQYEGDAHAVRAESVQGEILEALTELGGTATTAQIAKWLNKPADNVSRELAELVAKGKVSRGERQGKEVPYTLAGQG
jgi:hypothetical protein